MTDDQIERDLYRYLLGSYPEIRIRVEPDWPDPSRRAIYFTDPKFELIYPQQRFHYLTHLIPAQYQDEHLRNTVWFELAPGEKPEALVYPDDDLIASITPDVMQCVQRSGFFEELDDRLCPADADQKRESCYGDYRISRSILRSRGFSEDEYFDVFHVFMAQGGYCDCEILYNVAEVSRLKAEYWRARADGRTPYDPHGAHN